MAKKSRARARSGATDVSTGAPGTDAAAGAVGPRQPCPCGSGKRYKACHGAADAETAVFVSRPFEGLPGEGDVVALRELVPAATAPLTLAGPAAELAGAKHPVTLCSLLPAAAPAMVREDGAVWLGLQVMHHFGDPSRDLGAVLLAALEQAGRGEPGVVGLVDPPGPGPRLQDLVTGDDLDVTVHDGFDFWFADTEAGADESAVAAALEQANAAAAPSARLTSVPSAYWTRMGAKEHLRWVMTEPEGPLFDALARLHVAGADVLVPEARLVGMFRAHGLLTPVWDLPVGTGAEALEEPVAAFGEALAAALADGASLTSEERSARNGLANRQVTIR